MYNVPALVLGRAETVLGAVRGLGPIGVPVIRTGDARDYMSRSRHVWKRPPQVPPLAEFESLQAYLERAGLPPSVLIPCSDHWVREIVTLPEDLKSKYPSSSPSAACIDAIVDKLKLSALLRRHDFPAPKTIALESPRDLDVIPEEAGAYFLKPCESQMFSARTGVKAFRCGRAEARRLFEECRAQGTPLMAQEFIPGPPTEHHLIDGFIDRSGTVRALMARRRVRMYPLDFGNSTYTETLPLSVFRGLERRLVEILDGLGYRGIFSAEFKRDPRDGHFKLLEINTRVWGNFPVALDAGVNVVAMAYRDALGLDVETVRTYRLGVRWVDLHADRLACRSLYREGKISAREWLTSWLRASPHRFRWDDPLPSLFYFKEWAAGYLRRHMR